MIKSKIKVSKATAYRTLDLLVKYDFCRKMVLDDGIARYENKLDTEQLQDVLLALVRGLRGHV